MNIEEAKNLNDGDVVHCPSDKGDPAFSGKIVGNEHKEIKTKKVNLTGDEYIYLLIQGPTHKSVWPSTRIST